MKGLTWQIAADGTLRPRTERGEFPIWLDPEQTERLVSDLRRRQAGQPDHEYVPQPHASDGGVIATMRSNLGFPSHLAINALVSTVLHAVNFEAAPGTDLVEAYFERGWTDGLPVVPPTREKVDAVVDPLDREPDTVEYKVAPRWACSPVRGWPGTWGWRV